MKASTIKQIKGILRKDKVLDTPPPTRTEPDRKKKASRKRRNSREILAETDRQYENQSE